MTQAATEDFAAHRRKLDERIKASRRASAVERAWKVAKGLECRETLSALRWVEPQQSPETGLRRRIDFATEFPEGTTYLTPTPMYITVGAPASALVPGEDMETLWTMPMLTRMGPAPSSLDDRVLSKIGLLGQPSSIRNTIECASFMPFPRQDAPEEERFNPEFYVAIQVEADLGDPRNYFGAVVKFGDKVVKRPVSFDDHRFVFVTPDPHRDTLFNGRMLVNLGAEELAATRPDAGYLEIYLYRITPGGLPVIKKIIEPGIICDFSRDGARPEVLPLDADKGGHSDSGQARNLLLTDVVKVSSGKPARTPYLSKVPALPSTVAPPKPRQVEVGDVKIGEGRQGEEIKYESLEGYVTDETFAPQPIRIRFLGVREGTEEAVKDELQRVAAEYAS